MLRPRKYLANKPFWHSEEDLGSAIIFWQKAATKPLWTINWAPQICWFKFTVSEKLRSRSDNLLPLPRAPTLYEYVYLQSCFSTTAQCVNAKIDLFGNGYNISLIKWHWHPILVKFDISQGNLWDLKHHYCLLNNFLRLINKSLNAIRNFLRKEFDFGYLESSQIDELLSKIYNKDLCSP